MSKSMRRIFNTPTKKQFHSSLERTPQTPKRKPIFSTQKYSTHKKEKTEHIESSIQRQEWKADAVDFLRKMLMRVESKNKLLKQLEEENVHLRSSNQKLEQENQEVLKKIAAFSGVQKLKQKNSEYRAKILKAQALLYQLKRSLKKPINGLDELISGLHI